MPVAVGILLVVCCTLGCRGNRSHRDDADPRGSASAVSVAIEPGPVIPASADGTEEMRALDAKIERAGDHERAQLLLERAAIRGRLEDYLDALALSAKGVERDPETSAAWALHARALSRVHKFAEARAALERAKRLATDASGLADLTATIDEATGHHARAAAYREQRAGGIKPSPTSLAKWAGNLALAGRLDDALAVMPKAIAAVRHNPATLVAWLAFRWGRLHEQNGEHAAARRLYEIAHQRLPAHVETIVHLAEVTRVTGGDPRALIADAVAANPHPDLLALAGKTANARAAWERYVVALPEAFSDHAARFYLGPGADPKRALTLARANLANRDTAEARALAVEAALATRDPATACEVASPLAAGSRAHQFVAWRAFSACDRRAEADALAAKLGIQ